MSRQNNPWNTFQMTRKEYNVMQNSPQNVVGTPQNKYNLRNTLRTVAYSRRCKRNVLVANKVPEDSAIQ